MPTTTTRTTTPTILFPTVAGGVFGRQGPMEMIHPTSILVTPPRTIFGIFPSSAPFKKIVLCCLLAAASTRTSQSLSTQVCCQTRYHSNTPNWRTKTVTRMATTQSDSEAAHVVDPVQAAGLPHPIILGSASFTRKLILKEMGIHYEIVVRPIDEKSLGDRSKDKPSDLVLTLAKAKCAHLVSEIQKGNTEVDATRECIVLTGDQVVTHESEILEKPEDINEAMYFVARYGRSPPSTVGSCVLTHLPSNIQVSGVDTATIHFRPSIAESNLVEQLVALGEPVMSCAGGLMVEHPLVKEHLDHIDGTEDSVMGLSKDLVLRLLEELSTELTKAGYKK